MSLFVHIINKAFVLVIVNRQNDWVMQFLEIYVVHIEQNIEFTFLLRSTLDLSVLSKQGAGKLQKVHGRDQRTMPGITERYGLEGASGDYLVQPPAKAGSPTSGCTGPWPGRS